MLDSIKKIIDYNVVVYKAIVDTIPILKMIAPKCNIENKDSLRKLDTLSKYITNNLLTIDQINDETFREILEALVPRIKTPKEEMHILTGTIQRTKASLKESERFSNDLNFSLVDLYQIVANQL